MEDVMQNLTACPICHKTGLLPGKVTLVELEHFIALIHKECEPNTAQQELELHPPIPPQPGDLPQTSVGEDD